MSLFYLLLETVQFGPVPKTVEVIGAAMDEKACPGQRRQSSVHWPAETGRSVWRPRRRKMELMWILN